MFDLWIAVVIGIIEGLTEFLPVYSTGNMIIEGHWLGFKGETAETFEIVIQLGAIMAVVVLFWNRVIRLLGFGSMAKLTKRPDGTYSRYALTGKGLSLLHIFIAITPAMILAYLFRNFIKDVLFSPQTVLIGLVAGGLFMILAERRQAAVSAYEMDDLTYRQVFLVGLAQCLSLWPGFSRSGATIAGGMLAGASRAAAADFTFLIAIPVMMTATGYELLQNYKTMNADDVLFFAVGFAVSFVVALLAVVTFIKLVQKLKLTYFAYYRFVLAAIVLMYMLSGGFH